ncbi:V-type ATP synthase subunit D [Thermodesulfobacteriota bacterium]
MRLNVNPTRMELLNLKKRIGIAKRGHKLLKDKQDELMRRFLMLIKDVKDRRVTVEEALQSIFKKFTFLSAVMSQESLEESLAMPSKVMNLKISEGHIMNLKVPKYEITVEGDIMCYGYGETFGDLDLSLHELDKILKDMILLAEKEKTIELLADEIIRTRRRVNALEYILIPNLTDTIKYIGMRLSEMERGNLARLMKLKDIIRKH